MRHRSKWKRGMAKSLAKMTSFENLPASNVSPLTSKTQTPKRKSTHTYYDNLIPLTSTSTSILETQGAWTRTLSSNLQTSTPNPMFSFLTPETHKTSPSSGTVPDMPVKRPLSSSSDGHWLSFKACTKLVMGGSTRMCTRRVHCETRCLTCICVRDLVSFACCHFRSCSCSFPCKRKASISINHQLPIHWQDPKRRTPEYC